MGSELLTRPSGIPAHYDLLAEFELESIEQTEKLLAFDIEYRDTLEDTRRRELLDGCISTFQEILEESWKRVAKCREMAAGYRMMGIE